jgi:hypothetical protein
MRTSYGEPLHSIINIAVSNNGLLGFVFDGYVVARERCVIRAIKAPQLLNIPRYPLISTRIPLSAFLR